MSEYRYQVQLQQLQVKAAECTDREQARKILREFRAVSEMFRPAR